MTIRLLTSFTLIFLVNCSFAQKEINDSVQNQEVSISGYNKQKAISDIKNGIVFILLPGGIAAASALPNDEAFERKYGVQFISQGCVRSSGDNQFAYNEEVFKYLDLKFDKEWRHEIRTDAIGLKDHVK